MICRPSLLLMNSLALEGSATKDGWASTGALSKYMLSSATEMWPVPKGPGKGLQMEEHRNLRRGAGSHGVPLHPPPAWLLTVFLVLHAR